MQKLIQGSIAYVFLENFKHDGMNNIVLLEYFCITLGLCVRRGIWKMIRPELKPM